MVQIDTVSKPEAVKQQSRQLRGRIARDLADTSTPFDKEGYSLLKFHGIYRGYDRDSATERKQRGDDKVWQFMVRVRIPGDGSPPTSISLWMASPTVMPTGRCGSRPGKASNFTVSSRPGSDRRSARSMPRC